jgi:hypothetical protein
MLACLAAVAEGSPSQPAAAFRGLARDIHACTEQVMKLQAADLMQLKVYYQLGQIAQLPLRALATAATAQLPSVDPGVLLTLQNVTSAILYVDLTCSEAVHEPLMPSGAW